MSRLGGGAFVELVRLAVVAAGAGVSYQVARATIDLTDASRITLVTVLGTAISYVVGGIVGRALSGAVGAAEERLAAIPGADLVSGGLGIVAGVVVGSAIGLPLLLIPNRAVSLPMLALAQVVFGSLGYRTGIAKREDLLQLFGLTFRTRASDLRVLDTSAILNARLLDYVRAGLIRGTVLVPTFVLEEAQGIADSADPVRRRRAHHGLEALAAIRREGLADVRTVEKTYPEYEQVDAKVVALARERGGALVTDDAALARVAELQGVEVVLLRRVAAALRPQALPGEPVRLELQRRGSNPGQAVGYLDDGTMVVVEGGEPHVGQTVGAIVSRIVPTAGGQMLFARLPDASPQGDPSDRADGTGGSAR